MPYRIGPETHMETHFPKLSAETKAEIIWEASPEASTVTRPV